MHEEYSFWDELLEAWWGKVAVGVLFLLASWAVYAWLDPYDGKWNLPDVPWWALVAWWIGGKWVATGLVAAVGLFFVAVGVIHFRNRHDDEE